MLEAGELRVLLHSGQREALAAFEAAPRLALRARGSPPLGKMDAAGAGIHGMHAHAAGARVYGAPTLQALAEFVLPVRGAGRALPRLAPKWNAQKSHIEFPTPATCTCSARRQAQGRPGPRTIRRARIFDERLLSVLRYVLAACSAVAVALWRPHHRGKHAGRAAGHDFTGIAEKAEANGAYFNRDVWSNRCSPLGHREVHRRRRARRGHLRRSVYGVG